MKGSCSCGLMKQKINKLELQIGLEHREGPRQCPRQLQQTRQTPRLQGHMAAGRPQNSGWCIWAAAKLCELLDSPGLNVSFF